MVSQRQNGRRGAVVHRVWSVLMVIVCLLCSVLAQNCTSDESCQTNEFCNVGDGSCHLCLDCLSYNRNGSDSECPKIVSQDCGGCLPGFAQSTERPMDTDVNTGSEACQALDLVEAQSTDQTQTSTPDRPKAKNDHGSSSTSTSTNPSTAQKLTSAVWHDVSDLSHVHPTNLTDLDYDEFDAKRPWIYVGIAVTFFVLCGTCGVVGFKVYLLPRQLKRKQELRRIRAIERAEIKTRKTKEDIVNASKEEIERLYPDHGQDSTPLILRSYLNKTVREASY